MVTVVSTDGLDVMHREALWGQAILFFPDERPSALAEDLERHLERAGAAA